MPSNHLILCCPLLLPPSIFPNIRVFLNESVLCIRWPKYWRFSFNISPCNNIQDWFHRLIGFPCCLRDSQESSPTPQFKSINSSALSFLYIVQFSHPYMTTGKTIALTSGLNYFNGAFLLGFLWPIILICLVPRPYVAYLRILAYAHTRLLTKMDFTQKASPPRSLFWACVVRAVSWLWE